ncbi:hypothetical protein [Litorihabitans aurantiacus]|uniref:hypothetical protein n=1 Tax=Litorihabitans aurantiacus TaxID=1930061 RepID=UPI0032AF1888
MASLFWGRTRRKQDEQEQGERDRELTQRAGRALVEADERLRLTADELDFAVAELGEAATADLRAAVASVRTHLGEAFRLHQLNTDDIPDTPQELRERNARIAQLADWAQDLLDEKTRELERAVAKVREAPAVVENVRAEAARVRAQLPAAHETLERLQQRYSPAALRQVADNAGEVEQLISFAEHSLDVAARRRDAGNAAASTVALEAATEGCGARRHCSRPWRRTRSRRCARSRRSPPSWRTRAGTWSPCARCLPRRRPARPLPSSRPRSPRSRRRGRRRTRSATSRACARRTQPWTTPSRGRATGRPGPRRRARR